MIGALALGCATGTVGRRHPEPDPECLAAPMRYTSMIASGSADAAPAPKGDIESSDDKPALLNRDAVSAAMETVVGNLLGNPNWTGPDTITVRVLVDDQGCVVRQLVHRTTDPALNATMLKLASIIRVTAETDRGTDLARTHIQLRPVA